MIRVFTKRRRMAMVQITLAQVETTAQQRHSALRVCLAFAAATIAGLFFAGAQGPELPAFVPAYQVATALCYAVVAWLLFCDYDQDGAPATLILATGSVWTALILVAQLLSIPGMVGAQRALGGDQTTIHLWMWWHLGPPVFALLYAAAPRMLPARLADAERRRAASTVTFAGAGFSFVAVLALVTRFHDDLPILNHGGDYSQVVGNGVGPFVTLLTVAAAAAVWRSTRCRTVLQLWLVVSLVALVFDNLITMAGGRRNSVGWYIGRLEAFASVAILLLVYLRHIQSMMRVAVMDAAALQIELEARRRAESALAQSQKLESLGQLTGGVAHDFGNILHVLQSQLELVRRRTSEDAVRERVASALQTAARGGKLIKQLLTFAKRQPLHFETVDVNARLREVIEMARASLGKTRVDLDLAADLWPVLTDASELDASVLNLVINARDAMPGGGVLTVSTRNVAAPLDPEHPGDFVAIAFRDEGIGMTADVAARAWEPFFTTKGAGKGTGLGLSTVYGFVSLFGGTTRLSSSPGQGTEIVLYLPKGTPSVLPFDDADVDAVEPEARTGTGTGHEADVLPLFTRERRP